MSMPGDPEEGYDSDERSSAFLDAWQTTVREMVDEGIVTIAADDEGDGFTFKPCEPLIEMALSLQVEPEWLGTQVIRQRFAQNLHLEPDAIRIIEQGDWEHSGQHGTLCE